MTIRETLEELLKQREARLKQKQEQLTAPRRERLTAMYNAAPDLIAETIDGVDADIIAGTVGDAARFVALSLVQHAVEVVVRVEADALADVVAKAVNNELPVEVDVEDDGDMGYLDPDAVWCVEAGPKDISEDFAQWMSEHMVYAVEALVKSAADNPESRKNGD